MPDPRLFFQKQLTYPKLYIKKQWNMQSYAGAAVLTLIETRLSFCIPSHIQRASLVAQRLKRLPAMQETWVQSLGQEDPLEKEMATHSSILA